MSLYPDPASVKDVLPQRLGLPQRDSLQLSASSLSASAAENSLGKVSSLPGWSTSSVLTMRERGQSMWAQTGKKCLRDFLIPLLSVGLLEVVTGPTSQLSISFCQILLPSLPLAQALDLKTLLNKYPACLNSVSWSPSQRTTLQHFLTLLFSFVVSHCVACLHEIPGQERMEPYPG